MDDRTVRCWGRGVDGQLGNGLATGSNAPVTVTGISNAVAISAGFSHTCAVLVDGTMRCWGTDLSGELGNGVNVASRPLPDVVAGVSDAIGVSAGTHETCALRAESTASCWGTNDASQLAAADSNDHNTPTPVIANFVTVRGVTIPNKLAFLTQIQISDRHACSLGASGQPACWGDNTFGAVGDGTNTTPRLRPTAVNSFTANVVPAATVSSNGRLADVTLLLNCPAGDDAQITLSLAQGQVDGEAHGAAQCAGAMVRVPITVPAQGPQGFQAGAATAQVEAVIRENGQIVQDQHWTRAVTLSVAP